MSLTMPLKQAVLPLLDEVSDLAQAVGAVNTLTLTAGRREGDNTDVHGIVAALRAAGVDVGRRCSDRGRRGHGRLRPGGRP